jgi:Disulphide bond corrector protein DsbC
MRKLILLLLVLAANMVNAQTDSPVSWDVATVLNDSTKKIEFIQLNASLEKGWHIFAYDAGGDGLAINTTITIEKYSAKNKMMGKIEVKDDLATEKPVSIDMPGFGVVHLFDKNYSYLIPFAENVHHLKAKVGYQCCNDKMCLAPVNVVLDLQLQPNKK